MNYWKVSVSFFILCSRRHVKVQALQQQQMHSWNKSQEKIIKTKRKKKVKTKTYLLNREQTSKISIGIIKKNIKKARIEIKISNKNIPKAAKAVLD